MMFLGNQVPLSLALLLSFPARLTSVRALGGD